MNRTQLVNFLLRQRNGKRYLQVGFTNKDDHFEQINCQHRIAIGNKEEANFLESIDEYFEQHDKKFDLIFIDGYHIEEQVLKDVRNAYNSLTKNGIIVLHDCMPPDEWHQRGPELYNENESWNGTVWKAALRIFNQSTYKCTLLDTDWGCGIIDTAATQVPLSLDLPGDLNYRSHYYRLLKYKTSVITYLRDNVKPFYHLACMGNWKDVFMEQMLLLRRKEFQWIDMTVIGKAADIDYINYYLSELDLKANIIFCGDELTLFERPAFNNIQEYAKKYEGYVLYLHSKGVSNPSDEGKAKWRRLMMHELVENKRQCAAQLSQYDIIGVNWREMPPVSHFCGNFWYASTKYLRKLPEFNKYYENPRYRIWDQINSKRLGCEFWIGSCNEKARILSLAYRNTDFCAPGFWNNRSIPENDRKVMQ